MVWYFRNMEHTSKHVRKFVTFHSFPRREGGSEWVSEGLKWRNTRVKSPKHLSDAPIRVPEVWVYNYYNENRKKKILLSRFQIVEIESSDDLWVTAYYCPPTPPNSGDYGKRFIYLYTVLWRKKNQVTGNFTDWRKERNNPKNEILIVLKNLLHFLYTSIIFQLGSSSLCSPPHSLFSLV